MENTQITPAPITYKISTLQDIWNLPSIDAITRCLADIKLGMTQARATNEIFQEFLKDTEHTEKLFFWPEFIAWIDDGINEIRTHYVVDGESAFTVKMQGGEGVDVSEMGGAGKKKE